MQREALGFRSWSNVHRRGESGEQSPARKHPAPQPRDGRRPRPHCSGPEGCRGCGAAVQGVGPIPNGRLPPTPPSAALSAQPAGPVRQEVARRGRRWPGSPNPAGRATNAAEHPPAAERAATPAVRVGAADSAGPGQAATHPWRAHPSVRPSRSRRCGQSVRQPRGSGATSRSGAVARRARRSTGGSRPAGAAPGRAAALEQAGKRSSAGAPRPRRGRTPLSSRCCPVPPLHPSP